MQHIFIHGLGQNASSWDKTISSMTQPIDVVCPDLSALLDGKKTTYENLYRTFSDYCDSFSQPFNLCGLSLGGILALNYAIDYPDRVQSLVLIGTQYKMPIALLKFQDVIFRFMPQSVFKGVGFQKKDFIELTGSMIALDFSDKLKNITSPTLVLYGEKDSANKKAAQSLAEKIPGAQLQAVEDAGHETNMDSPKKLAMLLNKFYARLPPANAT